MIENNPLVRYVLGMTYFYPQNFVNFVSLSSFDECYLGEI